MKASMGLATVRQRLPSRQEALYLFIASAFVVNAWSILILLYTAPSFILRLRPSEMLVVASYTQAFALLESLCVFAALILLGILLPRRVFRDNWVPKGTIFIFLTALWTISSHLLPSILQGWQRIIESLNRILELSWSEGQLLTFGLAAFVILWAFSYFALLLRLSSRLHQRNAFVNALHSFLDRLLVLTFIYLALDILGAIVVITRILA